MASFIPVMRSKVNFKNNSNIPDVLAGIIVGKRNSGKTCLLVRMLLIDDILDYENLLIFTKTKKQPLYQMLFYGFRNNLSKESIRKLIESQYMVERSEDVTPKDVCEFWAKSNPEGNKITCKLSDKVSDIPLPEQLDSTKKNLVIFDDCINESQQIMNMYFTRGRHSSANVIYITQNLIKLDRHDIRGNANYFILFKQPNGDLTRFFRDMVSTDKSELEKFLYKTRTEFSKPYGYVAIDTDSDKLRLMDDIFTKQISSDSDDDDI